MNRLEHLISCLGEECDEVGQRCSKANRFGLEEIQPGQTLTNAERIVVELKDIIAVATILHREGSLPEFQPNDAEIEAKRTRIERFMVYAREQGALTTDGEPNDPESVHGVHHWAGH